jgi:type IV secretory pathway VirB3-like protein
MSKIKQWINKIKQNQFALWLGLIYATAVLGFSIFSVGNAVLVVILSFGAVANFLFSVLLIPLFIFIFIVNFLAAYFVGTLLTKLFKRRK